MITFGISPTLGLTALNMSDAAMKIDEMEDSK